MERRTRKATAFTLVGVVALTVGMLATLAPPGAAQGQSVSTSTLPEAGVLRLRTGAEDHFRFEPTAGSSLTQTWSSPGCRVGLGGPDSLVSLSSSPDRTFPGFFDDGFGVGSRQEGNGQPCGRIDPGQTLTLSLNGQDLPDVVADYAELDIEAKFGATIVVELWFDDGSGSTKTGQVEVPTGDASDSGPDSGDLDNFRVRAPLIGTTLFNRIVVRAANSTGSVALEGGADGTAPCDAEDTEACDTSPEAGGFSLGADLDTTDSLFHLIEVDGFLDCGATTDPQGGGDTPESTVTRLENATGDPEDCTPIPYNLDSSIEDCPPSSLQCVFLQKDLLGQDAQFFWEVTWAPEEGSYMETPTEFDFGSGLHALELCGPDIDGMGDPLIPTLPDNGDPWCVVDTQTNLDLSTGLVTVTEKYFGSGDPTGRR